MSENNIILPKEYITRHYYHKRASSNVFEQYYSTRDYSNQIAHNFMLLYILFDLHQEETLINYLRVCLHFLDNFCCGFLLLLVLAVRIYTVVQVLC